jgi:enoyl-CoA hydratase/carnithine racemase
MTDYSQILTEQFDDVLLITYNRPDRLNAWTRVMGDELGHAITEANADPSVHSW